MVREVEMRRRQTRFTGEHENEDGQRVHLRLPHIRDAVDEGEGRQRAEVRLAPRHCEARQHCGAIEDEVAWSM